VDRHYLNAVSFCVFFAKMEQVATRMLASLLHKFSKICDVFAGWGPCCLYLDGMQGVVGFKDQVYFAAGNGFVVVKLFGFYEAQLSPLLEL
jgi:hypothetical protein